MKKKQTLYKQLICVAIVISGIIFIGLGLLLPRLMLPIYERNIYQYLRQPLDFIQTEITKNNLTDIAYLYVTKEDKILVSENLNTIINLKPKEILDKINEGCNKFSVIGKTYYYCRQDGELVNKITITDNTYVLSMRREILTTLVPTLIIILSVSVTIVVFWSRGLVIKIGKIKKKIDNLDNYDYIDDYDYSVNDELSSLSRAIDNIKITLKEQEDYKNQMYQNISHDFKTPITVIKSHIEAVEDGMMTSPEGLKVIKEQILKLESKVHSLLYLNKLNYIKDLKGYEEKIDVKDVINSSVSKFKIQRTDVKFTTNFSGNTIFNGTFDMWEAVVDNLLNNFVRYAKKEIRVTIKNNKIIFYNDGPKIDEDILDSVFTPYTKGIKGQFGLGLSIIRKTLLLLNYEITVNNEKQGVSFIIK